MSAPVGTLQFNSYVGRNFTIFFLPGSFLLLTDSQAAWGEGREDGAREIKV